MKWSKQREGKFKHVDNEVYTPTKLLQQIKEGFENSLNHLI